MFIRRSLLRYFLFVLALPFNRVPLLLSFFIPKLEFARFIGCLKSFSEDRFPISFPSAVYCPSNVFKEHDCITKTIRVEITQRNATSHQKEVKQRYDKCKKKKSCPRNINIKSNHNEKMKSKTGIQKLEDEIKEESEQKK